MARVVLTEPGEQIIIGGEVEFIGTNSANDIVTVTGGSIAFDASFNLGGDAIILPGLASDYTVRLLGSRAILESSSISLSIPMGEVSTRILFDNGQAPLFIDEGAAYLGNQELTNSPQQVQPPPPPPPPPTPPPPGRTIFLDEDIVLTADDTVIRGYDAIILESGRNDDDDFTHTYEIEVDDRNLLGNGLLTVDASRLESDPDGAGPILHETAIISAEDATTYKLQFFGGGGDDRVIGSALNDILRGAAGSDVLSGRSGNDLIEGEAGADKLSGGNGADTLLGGGDSDLFSYESLDDSTASEGRDVIKDFVSGEDVLGFLSFDNLLNQGTFASAAAAATELIAGDGFIDILFVTDQHILWADSDDDGVIELTDFSVILEGVTSLGLNDIQLGGASDLNAAAGRTRASGVVPEFDQSPFSTQLQPTLSDPDCPSIALRGLIVGNAGMDVLAY